MKGKSKLRDGLADDDSKETGIEIRRKNRLV